MGGGADSSAHRPSDRLKLFSVLLAVLFLAVSVSPMLSVSDAAGDDYYSYTITPEGHIVGDYDPIGTSSDGTWTSVGNSNSGSWTWDEDGYGPFNSFYAAFDPALDNLMVCHLDPFDLDYSVDHSINISGLGYNIMWCLPTVYWLTDSSGNLVLTNDPGSGGVTYAHTIEGEVYAYVGFGVLEASTTTVNGQTILTSTSGKTPLVSQTRATFRDYANNLTVNTDGEGQNGYAMVWNFYQWELYKYCALAVMGTWDSQSIANGSTYGGSPFYDTPGLLDQSGPYAGTLASSYTGYTQPEKVFIENAWGSLYDFVDGIVFVDRQYYIDQSAVPTDGTSGTYITHLSSTLPSSGWGYHPRPMHRSGGCRPPTVVRPPADSTIMYGPVQVPAFSLSEAFRTRPLRTTRTMGCPM